MENITIIAAVMLVCVFVTMIVTIIKRGVEAAIKLWGVMGAFVGVGFGAILGYYFTDKSNQAEIQNALRQKEAALSEKTVLMDRIAQLSTQVEFMQGFKDPNIYKQPLD